MRDSSSTNIIQSTLAIQAFSDAFCAEQHLSAPTRYEKKIPKQCASPPKTSISLPGISTALQIEIPSPGCDGKRPWLAIEVLLEGRRGPSEAKAKLPSELRNANLAEKTCAPPCLYKMIWHARSICMCIYNNIYIYTHTQTYIHTQYMVGLYIQVSTKN